MIARPSAWNLALCPSWPTLVHSQLSLWQSNHTRVPGPSSFLRPQNILLLSATQNLSILKPHAMGQSSTYSPHLSPSLPLPEACVCVRVCAHMRMLAASFPLPPLSSLPFFFHSSKHSTWTWKRINTYNLVNNLTS